MSKAMIEIKEIAFDSELYHQSLLFRERILRTPLGLTLSDQDVDNEVSQIHILALDNSAVVKGTVVLYPQSGNIMKLRQMAVDHTLQGKGYGKKLVSFAERKAKDKGCKTIEMAARVEATKFYENLGYGITGDPYIELSIPHIKMKKSLI